MATATRRLGIDRYARSARKHLVPTLGRRPSDRLRHPDIEPPIVAQRKAALPPSTVRTTNTVEW